MSPSRPESAGLIGDCGSGGKIRTYDQAVNSRSAANGEPASNQSPNQSPRVAIHGDVVDIEGVGALRRSLVGAAELEAMRIRRA